MSRPIIGGAGVATALASIILFGATAAGAHSGPHPSPSVTPAPDKARDASAEAAKPAGPSAASSERAPVEVNLREAFVQHLHNKIVHFPLALGCGAALLLLLSHRWPQYWPGARLLLFLAAASAVAAYFSGGAQAEEFETGPLREYLERHELLGEASGIALVGGFGLAFVPRARRWLWIYALLLVALLSATGFLGGILAHTDV